MSQNKTSNIAKNTLLLYTRLLLVLVVSLYTVRIVLKTLGVVDYGINNVVGGLVTMFVFLSGTMSSACQRFYAYELGRDNQVQLKRNFASSLSIFLIISVVIFLVLETVGLWFLNNKMVIPLDRIEAANWVYQLAVFSFVLLIISTPYNAAIIAHEDMNVFALIGIVEVILKLLVVVILTKFGYDKLKTYALLTFIVTVIVSISYALFAVHKYKACRTFFIWHKETIRPMASYATWNIIGAVANVFKINGTNILLNMFFGPIVNAARAISVQVGMTINNFIVNFYMAVRPQITKAYAANQFDYFISLIFKSAKVSYFLLLILSMPILFETHFVLNLWLGEVPSYTVVFTRLFIINILIEAINNQLVAAIQAVGNIKKYQLVVSSILLLVLPISYIAFKLGATPNSILYITIFVTLISFIPQIYIVHKIVGLSIKDYVNKVVFVIFLVTLVSSILPFIVYSSLIEGWYRFIIVCILCIFSTLVFSLYIGFSSNDRTILLNMVKTKIKNK